MPALKSLAKEFGGAILTVSGDSTELPEGGPVEVIEDITAWLEANKRAILGSRASAATIAQYVQWLSNRHSPRNPRNIDYLPLINTYSYINRPPVCQLYT